MRRTRDGEPLTARHLREHAKAVNGPFWEGHARQLLDWAADLLDAAELAVKQQRGSSHNTSAS
jgi:hypothetical protein